MTKKNKVDARATAVMSAAAMAAAGFCNSARGSVVIQEIYADGGFSSTTTYQNDYVELYNNNTMAVSLAGYSLEYGGYTQPLGGTSTAANAFDIITLTNTNPVAAGGYYLIELPPGLTGTKTAFPGVAAFPTPNQANTNSASAFEPSYFDAKIGLVNTSGVLVDYVGYGTDQSASATVGVNSGMTYPAYAGAGPANNQTNPSSTSAVFTGTNALTRISFADDTTATGDTATENNAADFQSDTPDPMGVAAAPEPTSLGFVAVGGAMLIARRRSRA